MKTNLPSRIDQDRQIGKHQVDDQRAAILDAAETLFLKQGLDQTTMADIARETGIHRVTLYRYFPDLHPIAFEIAVRMLKRIREAIGTGQPPFTLEFIREMILRMIDQFYPQRDAYRYLGMFDHLYGAAYPNPELAAWYKAQIFSLGWGILSDQEKAAGITPSPIAMVGNTTMSFLEKLAARGELLAGEQEVSLDDQLACYKDMVSQYFDSLAASKQ